MTANIAIVKYGAQGDYNEGKVQKSDGGVTRGDSKINDATVTIICDNKEMDNATTSDSVSYYFHELPWRVTISQWITTVKRKKMVKKLW